MSETGGDVRTGVVAAGRVAVVTGAASGIGLGLAGRLAAEGMRVVMADIEEPVLKAAADRLAAGGAEVLPVVTDVSRADQVDSLRDQALSAFGTVNLVCNNAGVDDRLRGAMWELPLGEWEWMVNVNLWGVVHGVRAFMPALLEAEVGYMVNTASIFGVIAGSSGPYGVSKHAVVALTETLHFNLLDIGSSVGLSVLCPGPVETNIGDSERNRPASAGPAVPRVEDKTQAERQAPGGPIRPNPSTRRTPEEVADIVVNGIRERRFYLLTSSNRNEAVRRRGEEIVGGLPPERPFP